MADPDPDKPQEFHFLRKYFAGLIAATAGELVTYPCDLTKTRMILHGENAQIQNFLKDNHQLHQKPYIKLGMIQTASNIIKHEGFFKLWGGLSAALYRQAIYAGIRMNLYEKLRDDIIGFDEDGEFPLHKAVFCGMVAGYIGQFTSTPADLCKVKLQMEGYRVLQGGKRRYKSVPQVVKSVYRHNGFTGFWKGWVPSCQRASVVNLGDLTTYDILKRFLVRNMGFEDNYVAHIISSLAGGFNAAVLGAPVDVIKTRIMNQPTKNGVGLYYKNSIDCLQKTIQHEGWMALYKGFLPLWFRLGPWSLTFWVIFEQTRVLFGVTTF